MISQTFKKLLSNLKLFEQQKIIEIYFALKRKNCNNILHNILWFLIFIFFKLILYAFNLSFREHQRLNPGETQNTNRFDSDRQGGLSNA